MLASEFAISYHRHHARAPGNGAIDLAAAPSVTKPPFLMYEPQEDGSMKLVGVDPTVTCQFTPAQLSARAHH